MAENTVLGAVKSWARRTFLGLAGGTMTGALNLGGFALFGNSLAIVEETGTTLTLTESHNGKMVRCTNAAAITVTFPEEATEVLSVGHRSFLVQGGAGQITFAKEGTDTIESVGGNLKISAQYGSACVIKRTGGAPSTWLLLGDLAA